MAICLRSPGTADLSFRFLCIEYRRPYIISEQVNPSRPNYQHELIILSQHADVALPLNLDEADIVDTPNLIGKPVEEPTEYRENNYHFYGSVT
jgi:hypothetical protein